MKDGPIALLTRRFCSSASSRRIACATDAFQHHGEARRVRHPSSSSPTAVTKRCAASPITSLTCRRVDELLADRQRHSAAAARLSTSPTSKARTSISRATSPRRVHRRRTLRSARSPALRAAAGEHRDRRVETRRGQRDGFVWEYARALRRIVGRVCSPLDGKDAAWGLGDGRVRDAPPARHAGANAARGCARDA